MQQSVASAFKLYLQRAKLKPNSVEVKWKAMNHFLRYFGDLPIGEVTMAIAEDYQVMLSKDVCLSTTNTYVASLGRFWKWLHSHRRIDINPWLHLDRYKVDEKPRDYFTIQDLEKLVNGLGLEWRVRLAFGLIGCRRGQMFNCLIREIHLEGHTPHIELSYRPNSDTTWEWGNKNHKVDYFGLPEQMQVGRATLNVHKDIVELMEYTPQKQPYLCLESRRYRVMIEYMRNGTLPQWRINDPCGNFNKMWRSRQRRCGIEKPKRFHELRASYVTQMIDKVGIRRAQQAVGHASIQTTARYDRSELMDVLSISNRVTQNCYTESLKM